MQIVSYMKLACYIKDWKIQIECCEIRIKSILEKRCDIVLFSFIFVLSHGLLRDSGNEVGSKLHFRSLDHL